MCATDAAGLRRPAPGLTMTTWSWMTAEGAGQAETGETPQTREDFVLQVCRASAIIRDCPRLGYE